MFSKIHEIQFFSDFCNNLRYHLSQGEGLLVSLESIEKQAPPSNQKKINQVICDIKRGKSLPAAISYMLPFGTPFSMAEITIMSDIDPFLERVAIHYKKKIEFFQSVTKQMAYPAFLLGSLLIMSVVFAFQTLPEIDAIYAATQQPLPKSLFLLKKMWAQTTHSFTISIWIPLLTCSLFWIISRARPIFIRLFFPHNLTDFFWIIATLTQNGVSLKNTLTSINPPQFSSGSKQIKKMIADVTRCGQLVPAIIRHIELPQHLRDKLTASHQASHFGFTLMILSDDLRLAEERRFTKLATRVQPVLLILIGAIICLFFSIFLFPLTTGLINQL
ncbi:MAG: type II secretory pathway component PulF [Candidatus Marinamargulisbacteria bacterium]|jgi:type II secretory pathway component PulF